MAYRKLDDYVRKARALEVSEDQMRRDLRDAGWWEDDIESAIKGNPLVAAPTPPPGYRKGGSDEDSHGAGNGSSRLSPAPTSGSSPTMWDAFEHILMFISLYVLAISFGLTLHFFVDKWVPGTPTEYRQIDSGWQLSALRGYLAALIVSYPLFAFLFLRITERTMNHPAVRSLKARKFLIYLTLVVTFVIVIGSTVSIIYNFLNGNVTPNFFLSFLITVSISGSVFAYYLSQVKEDRIAYA
jgi:hypothetical protein